MNRSPSDPEQSFTELDPLYPNVFLIPRGRKQLYPGLSAHL